MDTHCSANCTSVSTTTYMFSCSLLIVVPPPLARAKVCHGTDLPSSPRAHIEGAGCRMPRPCCAALLTCILPMGGSQCTPGNEGSWLLWQRCKARDRAGVGVRGVALPVVASRASPFREPVATVTTSMLSMCPSVLLACTPNAEHIALWGLRRSAHGGWAWRDGSVLGGCGYWQCAADPVHGLVLCYQ